MSKYDDDISFATEAKSDQLNAVDIMGAEPILTIRDFRVIRTPDQPVWLYFNGDNGRPWKPSKGMIRILGAAWGRRAGAWVGKSVQVYFEPDVTYAGKKAGGIRIKALSDIERQMDFTEVLSRNKRRTVTVVPLTLEAQPYPQEEFDNRIESMVKAMTHGIDERGPLSLQQVIAMAERGGKLKLAPEQIEQLEKAAPEVFDENENEETQ